MSTAGQAGPVLLFDGECGLCNRLVRLLLRLDSGGVLRFAPLQGPSAQEFLRMHELPLKDFDSLVFVAEWSQRKRPDFLRRTEGAMAALRACGGAGRMLARVLRIFPATWRDAGYRMVARCRHRLFGPWQPRPLPRPEWAARFLE